jgi:hypothetical protein
MLEACRRFETVDTHADQVCRELGFDFMQLPEVKKQLREFVANGMLYSHSSMLDKCIAAEKQNDIPPIASLGVPTRNRPESLRQCLSSYLEDAREFDRTLDVVVADGSTSDAMRNDNLAVLEELKQRFGANIFYVGEKEKEEFAQEIARRADLPLSVIAFAMRNPLDCPQTTGTNRNALLLATAGELTVQVDDDTQCRIAPACEQGPGVRLSSLPDPTMFWSYGQDDDITLADKVVDKDFFSLHEQILGKTIGGCINQFSPEQVNLDETKSSFFNHVRGDNAAVRVTALGSFGDSGIGGYTKFLTMDGAQRAQFYQSESTYRNALTTKRVMRAASEIAITEGELCMGINLGLDNRDLLPPFTPVQRNQDGVFGSLLKTSNSFFGYLPWMIHHQAPSERKKTMDDLLQLAGNVYVGDIIPSMVGFYMPRNPLDPATNMQVIGKGLIAFSKMAQADCLDTLRHTLWRGSSSHLSMMEQLLQKHGGKPEFWKSDVKAHQAAFRNAILSDEFAKPCDLREAFGADAATEMLQRIVGCFGELLCAWAQIMKTVKEMRQDGWRPGIRV